jgi:hypothetical protein
VTFPAKSYQDYGSVQFIGTTGGTMALGTYRYRIASRPQQGGPIVAKAEQSYTLLSPNTAIMILVQNFQQSTTYIEGLTIYRGTTAGVYTQRYDVVPNADWFGLGSTSGDRHHFTDRGPTLLTNADSGQLGHGYPDTISPNLTGSLVPADETNLELDATYKIFLEPSWLTTWVVTAKRTNGFDVSFGTGAPVGGGTVNWMLVR